MYRTESGRRKKKGRRGVEKGNIFQNLPPIVEGAPDEKGKNSNGRGSGRWVTPRKLFLGLLSL